MISWSRKVGVLSKWVTPSSGINHVQKYQYKSFTDVVKFMKHQYESLYILSNSWLACMEYLITAHMFIYLSSKSWWAAMDWVHVTLSLVSAWVQERAKTQVYGNDTACRKGKGWWKFHRPLVLNQSKLVNSPGYSTAICGQCWMLYNNGQ